jgi:4-carboxymuconolactone decarboxylase
MPRVNPIFRPQDCPEGADDATRQAIAEFFEQLFPGNASPEINTGHTGLALAAHSPKFAGNLSRLTRSVVLETGWTERRDLPELAVQAVNLHFSSAFSFETRMGNAEATGLGMERLAALPCWRASTLFDEEQRLVLEYVAAVVSGDVPGELFDRVKARYGEKGAVELTALVGTFSLWAMLINATL